MYVRKGWAAPGKAAAGKGAKPDGSVRMQGQRLHQRGSVVASVSTARWAWGRS
jgi:hypothetical protein